MRPMRLFVVAPIKANSLKTGLSAIFNSFGLSMAAWVRLLKCFLGIIIDKNKSTRVTQTSISYQSISAYSVALANLLLI